MTKLGVNGLELAPATGRRLVEGACGADLAPRGKALTDEQKAEQKLAADALKKWRLGLSMDRMGNEFRKKYEEAGMLIQIVKFDGIDEMDDDVVDYCFNTAKALGARAISCEYSGEPDAAPG
jgi:hypothetical protein